MKIITQINPNISKNNENYVDYLNAVEQRDADGVLTNLCFGTCADRQKWLDCQDEQTLDSVQLI